MFKPKNKLKEVQPEEIEEVQEEEVEQYTLKPKEESPAKVTIIDDYFVGEIPTQTTVVIVNKKTKEQLDVHTALAKILNTLAKFEKEFDKG